MRGQLPSWPGHPYGPAIQPGDVVLARAVPHPPAAHVLHVAEQLFVGSHLQDSFVDNKLYCFPKPAAPAPFVIRDGKVVPTRSMSARCRSTKRNQKRG
jgi:hypothetical protein